MGANSDRPSGTEKIDTVPPPPGEDDAYSAPTRVGELPPAVLELMRQKDAERANEKPKDAPKAKPAGEPKVAAKAPEPKAPEPKAADKPKVGAPPDRTVEEALDAMMMPSAKMEAAPAAPEATPAVAKAVDVPEAAAPVAAAIPAAEPSAPEEEEDVATMLFNHPKNAPAAASVGASIEAAPQSSGSPTQGALLHGSGEVVSQDILSPDPVASPLAPPPLALTGRNLTPTIIALAAALVLALGAVLVLALR